MVINGLCDRKMNKPKYPEFDVTTTCLIQTHIPLNHGFNHSLKKTRHTHTHTHTHTCSEQHLELLKWNVSYVQNKNVT